MPLFCKTCKCNDRYLSFYIYIKIVCMLLRLINFCWIVLIWANLWPFSRADKLHYWFVVKNWGLKVVLYMMVLQWFRRRIFWCLILHHFCYFTQNWFVLRSTFYHVALTFRSGFSLGGLLFWQPLPHIWLKLWLWRWHLFEKMSHCLWQQFLVGPEVPLLSLTPSDYTIKLLFQMQNLCTILC